MVKTTTLDNGKSKLTTKQVLERIREIGAKQRIAEQKAAKAKIVEQQKEIRVKGSCKICGKAVTGMIENTKKIIEDIKTLEDMYRNNLYTVRFKGFDRSRDDIMAMINTDECNIKKQIELYEECCKKGIQPTNSRIRC